MVGRISIFERQPWNAEKLIILVGPGGAGKSTLGPILARLMDSALIDLDDKFSTESGNIDQYIRIHGYARYKEANSQLAERLLSNLLEPTVFVASSGFLSLDNPPAVLAENKRLLKKGFTVSLLPHTDIEIAANIIVERQMRRGLYQNADQQRQTILERFAVYECAGDMLVASTASPSEIANAIAERLKTYGETSKA